MEQRISLISLGVKNLERSTAFYETLGWKCANKDAPGISFFQVGCMIFGLYPRDKLAEDAGVPDDGSGFSGTSLAYNVREKDDVEVVLGEAVAAGAKLIKPAQDVFWGGYHGYFADPDGYLWEIAWNPFFPIAKSGAITLPD